MRPCNLRTWVVEARNWVSRLRRKFEVTGDFVQKRVGRKERKNMKQKVNGVAWGWLPWTVETTQKWKDTTTKPHSLHLISGPHMVDGGKWLPKVVSDFYMYWHDMYILPPTHTEINKIYKTFLKDILINQNKWMIYRLKKTGRKIHQTITNTLKLVFSLLCLCFME